MKRACEGLLAERLRQFPCVAIIGPRQCGKTTLLGTLPDTWKRIDLEQRADFQAVSQDPDLFFRLNPCRVAFDEAQILPSLFSALRVAIDSARTEKGRYVITGSSSPALLRSVSESLAGRIAIIEMAPFSWSEICGERKESFVERLMDRRVAPNELIAGLKPRGDIREAHRYWFLGGYPEPWLDGTATFHSAWMEQYIQTYLYRDVGRLFPGLDQVRFRQFLLLLGGLSGTVINHAEVARALGVSQPTARDYFEIAHGTFLWRRLTACTRDATHRLVKHPKGYLRDSGLLHHLLRIPDLDALLGHPRMGASWEGMVIEEVLRQLTALGAGFDASFYRTSSGGEVDLVIESDFGPIAIEIKYTQGADWRDLRALRNFVAEQKCRVGVLISNDVAPRLYDDKIVGVPFVCL
jgi:hypothetical protein